MDAPTYNMDDEREAAIVAWRLLCFEGVGLSSIDASSLAVRRDVDRERVERLVAAGATGAQVRGMLL